MLLPLVLAGCLSGVSQSTPKAEVREVILYRNTLTVQMSDGQLCVGARPGAALRWSGVLQGCLHRLTFSVDASSGLPVRAILTPAERGIVEVEGQAYRL